MTTIEFKMFSPAIFNIAFFAIFSALALTPVTASAAANLPYQPQNSLELISYLQGVVDSLKAQINAQKTIKYDAASTKVETDEASVEVKIEVELSASFDIGSNSYVNAWFEYGVGNVLNKKTSEVRLRRSGNQVNLVKTLTNLQTGTSYVYRAVFETSAGKKYYGEVKTFSTGGLEYGSVISGSTGSSMSSSRGTLSTNAREYQLYRSIEVSWSVPASKKDDNDNWIGMYKVGKNDKNDYTEWRPARGQSGVVVFDSYYTGNYEFRLYLEGQNKYFSKSSTIKIVDK